MSELHTEAFQTLLYSLQDAYKTLNIAFSNQKVV